MEGFKKEIKVRPMALLSAAALLTRKMASSDFPGFSHAVGRSQVSKLGRGKVGRQSEALEAERGVLTKGIRGTK